MPARARKKEGGALTRKRAQDGPGAGAHTRKRARAPTIEKDLRVSKRAQKGSVGAQEGTLRSLKKRGTAAAAARAGAAPHRAKPVQAEIICGEGGETTAIAEHVREVRGHLTRMRRADDMLQAYETPRNAAGIQPSSELAKARAVRAKAIEGVVASMDALAACMTAHEQLGGGSEDGISAEAIFCSACGGYDTADGNDILLCDCAGCNHAYHQRCIEPAVSDVQLEAEEWFCPVCEAIDGLLDGLNEYLGQSWGSVRDIFPKQRSRLAGEEAESSEEEAEPDDDYVDSDRSSEPASAGGESGEECGADFSSTGGSAAASGSGSSDVDEEEEEEEAEAAPLGPRRPRVDYAALAQELFGDEEDEDADSAADVDFAPTRRGAAAGAKARAGAQAAKGVRVTVAGGLERGVRKQQPRQGAKRAQPAASSRRSPAARALPSAAALAPRPPRATKLAVAAHSRRARSPAPRLTDSLPAEPCPPTRAAQPKAAQAQASRAVAPEAARPPKRVRQPPPAGRQATPPASEPSRRGAAQRRVAASSAAPPAAAPIERSARVQRPPTRIDL